MKSLRELRDVALRIALEVADIPADAQPRVPQARTMSTATKANEFDLVTELDRATELAITQRIASYRPGDGVLGEEGAASESTTGYTWIVDPIDGTVNYFFGHPHWAISLGVVDATGEPVVGVVHAPQLGETYVAAKGQGAYLILAGEWIPLAPPPQVELGMAIVATGFSYDRSRRVDMARVIASLVPRVRDMRRAGAASLDICAVAAGRIHGYYERDTQPWDRAAGYVVAKEVGLDVLVTGSDLGQNLAIVAAPELAAVLREELAALGVTD
jgi:myo-inositol-1(or 4)-monophosphatase